jgi:beta-galactosidase
VLIENLYDFTDLDQFSFSAKIKADGAVLKVIDFEKISVETHTGKLIRIPLKEIDFKENTEYFLELSAKTRDTWGLLPQNFEVAHEQIALESKVKKMPVDMLPAKQTLTVSENAESVLINNEDVNLVFSKKTGLISSFTLSGNRVFKDGKSPRPNFWRAVTDNDFGNGMERNNIAWKEASINHAVSNFDYKNSNDNVIVSIEYQLPGVETTFQSVYTIQGNGVIGIDNTLNTTEYQGDIPRIGMRMQVPRKYNNLTYFGRGPWENYQDRKSSAFVDIYSSKVKDQYVPYISPQDNGYKTDVRWLSVSDQNDNGYLFVGKDSNYLSFSALHMEQEDFDSTNGLDYKNSKKNKHTIDIKEKDLVELNIDLGQRGVAGDDSWYSKPQEKYQFKGDKTYQYSFYIIPFENQSKEDFIKISKLYSNKM